MKSYAFVFLAAAAPVFATACARNIRVDSGTPSVDLAPLRTTLRTAAAHQEIHYANPSSNYTYASTLTRLVDFTPERGVTMTILEASQKGWAGMATGQGVACVFYVGEVGRVPATPRGTAASASGVVTCDPER